MGPNELAIKGPRARATIQPEAKGARLSAALHAPAHAHQTVTGHFASSGTGQCDAIFAA